MIRLDIANTIIREGWISIDIEYKSNIRIDISKEGLPFSDNEVDAIYSSHTLEHIYPDRVDFVLSEFYRVLKPGALVRIVVPDFVIAMNAYMKGDFNFLRDKAIPLPGCIESPLQHLISWCHSYYFGIDNTRKFGHVTGFDKDTVELLLKRAKFININRMEFAVCSEIFNDCDLSSHKECSLYMEGKKL